MSLKEDKSKNTLVIGIGNPLRCDDGVGPYVADCIEAKDLKHVHVWVTQQLHLEDLEAMLKFGKIILVDASIAGPPVNFYQVKISKEQTMASSSHHLSTETFVNLARSIYNQDLPMHLCSIRGNNFEIGDKISSEVLKRAQEAVELICTKVTLPNK